MAKINNNRLITRFHIIPTKGIELGMPSLEKNRRGFGDLEILLD